MQTAEQTRKAYENMENIMFITFCIIVKKKSVARVQFLYICVDKSFKLMSVSFLKVKKKIVTSNE